MSRPIGSRSSVATKRELEGALRLAYHTAISIGSDWEALPGSVRLPWLDQAHDLADMLARVHPGKPAQITPDMTPFPESKVLHTAPGAVLRITEAERRKRHREACPARAAAVQPGDTTEDRDALARFWHGAYEARRKPKPAGDAS
jgi:hypothetical protein